MVIVLHPVGHDEVTPYMFSALLGVIITELQGGLAYTTMQAHPQGTVPSVKMIRLDTFDVTSGIQ